MEKSKLNSPEKLLSRHNNMVDNYNKGRYHLYDIINRLEKEYTIATEGLSMRNHPEFKDIK